MWVTIIMFVGLGAFSLGMIYQQKRALQEHPLAITYSSDAVALWEEYQSLKRENQDYFASKNGSVVYPVGCSRGNTIKEENKVFFDDIQSALNLGYKEASGC